MRFYQGTRLVLYEAAALIRRQGDEIALRGADAHGIDLQAVLLRRLCGRGQGVPFEILAVRYQYEDLVASGPTAQRCARGFDGARNVGPAVRNRVDVDGVQ